MDRRLLDYPLLHGEPDADFAPGAAAAILRRAGQIPAVEPLPAAVSPGQRVNRALVKVCLVQPAGGDGVDCPEGLLHALRHPADGQIRPQLPQVHHPGADRRHPLGLQLRLGGAQVPAHGGLVHVHQQGAVVVASALVLIEGVAGELPAVRQYVVAP